MDYTGGRALQTSKVANGEECAAKCEKNPKCTKAVFVTNDVSTGGLMCYQKQFGGEPFAKEPKKHRIAYSIVGREDWALAENDMDYTGGRALQTSKVAHGEECAVQCEKNPQCTKAVFVTKEVSADGLTCYQKQFGGEPFVREPKKHRIAYSIVGRQPEDLALLMKTQHPYSIQGGKAYAQIESADAKQCGYACVMDPHCDAAVRHNDEPSSNCHLLTKSGTLTFVPHDHRTGVMVTGRPT
jgi:uncharacterized protein YbcV (DUF1398 family)